MKKLLTFLVAAMLLSGALGGGKAQAYTFDPGGNYFLMNGYSYLYQQTDDSNNPTALWGLFSVNSISPWFPIANDIAGAIGTPTWSIPDDGLGEHFAIKFGGLVSPTITAEGVIWNTTNSFAELWLVDFNAFGTEAGDLNSDVLAGIGDGTINSFGNNISSNGQKLLDLSFDSFITAPVLGAVNALGYLSVEGGMLADIFDSDFFYNGADLAINGQNYVYIANPDIEWNYTANNYAAYANVVPEPGTLLLLGAGMLGLAASARKRRQN